MAMSPFGLNRWARGSPWGAFHSPMTRSYWDEPEYSGARWAVDPYSTRCCELCDLRHKVPDLSHILSDLSLWDPYHHASIMQMYDGIHKHVMLGCDRDGPESYYLSRDAEEFARALMRLERRSPWGGRGLGDFARQVQYLGRDMQIGRRRSRFHGGGRPRYYDGGYHIGGGWPYEY